MRILVVEDEVKLAEIIGRVLQAERYEVDLAFDGDHGLDLALAGAYDAIVLDRMLPGLDGLELCRHLRQEGIQTPVLMLTARRELPDRVEGLDAGADDYLGKPFAFAELQARIRALTRRGERPLLPSVLRVRDLTLDPRTRRVTRDGREIDLNPREFALLEYLLRYTGQVLSRDQILERVWGYEAEPEGNVIDLYIYYLRRKLDEGHKDSLIQTVRRVGYVIRE